ncbi:MAG: nicotinate-nucleotide adenylyltransferase [Clostridia bacterium]|nr:nicotinate-nucleotide adenylyltransferase [Clostridia bacterium]
MRIGIMGGTLDPVHRGHVEIALRVKQEMALDQVMLLPAGDPPHKGKTTPKADRLRMAELAASEHEGLFASDVEINREGTTFTVDTLTQLSEEQPETEWVYIVGADTLDVLDSWRNFVRIAGLCSFAAVGRPGNDNERIRRRADELKRLYGAKIFLMDFDGPDISSTEIRRCAAEGLDIRRFVPDSVAEYIREKGLYLCAYNEDKIVEKLRKHISKHRLEHTMGVAYTAKRLAERFGVDPCRAYLAGLLHDCAKGMEYDEMCTLVRESVPDADDTELGSKAVLHAPAGMVVARNKYGVRDAQILSAIRKHTLGAPDMSAMDALIYVADFIEPGRKSFPGLKKAREAAEEDIFRALRICAELSNDYVKGQGLSVHPRTQDMLSNIN